LLYLSDARRRIIDTDSIDPLETFGRDTPLPRRPENSVLHKIVSDKLPAFLDHAEQTSGGLRFPRFVIDELRYLLDCGEVGRGNVTVTRGPARLHHGYKSFYPPTC
jgi:hypothetical protein